MQTVADPFEFLDRRKWGKQCENSFGIAGNTGIKPQVWTVNAERCTSLLGFIVMWFNASNPYYFDKFYSGLMTSHLCSSHTVPMFVDLW